MEVKVPEGYPATRLSEFLSGAKSGVTMEIKVEEGYASQVLSFLDTKKDWDDQRSATRFEFYLNNTDLLRRVHRPDGSFDTVYCRLHHPVDQCTVHVKKHAFVNELRLKHDEYETAHPPPSHDNTPIVHVDRVRQVDETSYRYHGWQYSLVKTFDGKTLSEVQDRSRHTDKARYTVCIVPLEDTVCHSYIYRAVDYLLKAESVLNTKVQFEIAVA